MKRSEMIELISDFLDHHVVQEKGYAWKYSKQSADILLSQLEEAGMLPPQLTRHKNELYEDEVDGLVKHRHQWEWEDE